MKTRLKLKYNDTWEYLDLYEELPLSVVISQDEITDIGGSPYSYSKTFTIPGTKHNNDTLKGFYSVVGIDFDTLRKVECVVEYGGNIVFEGFLRLNSVLISNDYLEYEVYILTSLSDFSSEIQPLQLNDLDYQDLDHENNYDNITLSWEYTGGTSGLFGGQVLYPLYNYGLIYNNNNQPSFDFRMTGNHAFTSPGNAIPEEYFKPAIQLKSVLDRLFSATSYSYNSDFLNSDYFKSQYMSLANNGEIGVNREDQNTENRNKFKVYVSEAVSYTFDPNDLRKPIPFNTLSPDGYDPLNSFTLDNDFPNNSNDDFRNYFNVPTSGDYFFNIRFAYVNNSGFNAPTFFRLKVYKSTNPNNIDGGTLLFQTGGSGYAALGTQQNANVFFSGSLQSNEYVSAYIEIDDSAGFPQLGVSLLGFQGRNTPMWELYTAPQLLGSTNVNMKLQMPDMTASDFFQSLIIKYNLVIEKNDIDRVLNIEPWNTYFNESGRTITDWTQKIDRNTTIRVEPLDFNLSKDIIWGYESSDDYVLGKFYEDNFNDIFGTKRFTSRSNILTGKQELTIPFASFPTNTIDGSGYVIMGETFKLDDNGLKRPTSGPPHLFFWVGNRYMYSNEIGIGENQWYLSSGATQVGWNTYPAVNHLSRLGTFDSDEISDLNFTPYWDFFVSRNSVVQPWSRYTLYNSFWEDYIDNLYSNEARRLKGRFLLSPKDIGEIKLNDKIYLKDNYWRIENIKDADLIKDKLTEVSLLKELGGYYQKQIPPPVYDVTPNQDYPPASNININWFFENKVGSNITFPELFIQREFNNIVLLDIFNQFGSGSFTISPDILYIAAGFTYSDLTPLSNIEITIGSTSGDDTFGRLNIPDPQDNVFYELTILQGFGSAQDIYITIDTYQ